MARILGKVGKLIVAPLLLVASAWYIWTQFHWEDITPLLVEVRSGLLILGCGTLYIVYLFIRTCRWLVMVRSSNRAVRFSELYLPTAVLLSFSLVTPAQLGEAFKVEVLKRRGLLSRVEGIGSFIIERLADVIVVLILALVSGPTAIPFMNAKEWYLALGTGIALTIGLLIILIQYKRDSEFGRWLELFRSTIRAPMLLPKILLLTLLSWLVVAWLWQVAMVSIGVHLGIFQTVAVMTLSTLGAFASFIPGGVGVSEIMIAEILPLFGVDAAQAQAGAIVMRLAAVIWMGIGILHIGYWWFFSKMRSGHDSSD